MVINKENPGQLVLDGRGQFLVSGHRSDYPPEPVKRLDGQMNWPALGGRGAEGDARFPSVYCTRKYYIRGVTARLLFTLTSLIQNLTPLNNTSISKIKSVKR